MTALAASLPSTPHLFNAQISCPESSDADASASATLAQSSQLQNLSALVSPATAEFEWHGIALPNPALQWTRCIASVEVIWSPGGSSSAKQLIGLRSEEFTILPAPEYNDGDRMVIEWNFAIIALSYFCSVFGSWVTLLLIDEAMDDLRLQQKRKQKAAQLAKSGAVNGPGGIGGGASTNKAGGGKNSTTPGGTSTGVTRAVPKPPKSGGHWQWWLLAAALALGGCAIWSMHFLGMASASLKTQIYFSTSFSFRRLGVFVL